MHENINQVCILSSLESNQVKSSSDAIGTRVSSADSLADITNCTSSRTLSNSAITGTYYLRFTNTVLIL